MFSFSRSGRGPTLPRAGKCPSVAHVRPSIGSGCHSQGTGAVSPRCTQSHYPGPRTKNPPPPRRRLGPHRAATRDPAQAKRWNLTGWRSQKQQRAGLIGCRQWRRSPGSSSSGRSEDSAERSKRKKGNVGLWIWTRVTFCLIRAFPLEDCCKGRLHLLLDELFFRAFASQEPRIYSESIFHTLGSVFIFFRVWTATTGMSNSVI